MLGNLIKYEIQATRRIFLPLYGLIVVFACINKVFLSANYNKIEGVSAIPFWITMTVYILLITALFVMTLVVLIQRFQKNLLSDEGYLSFTLPIKTHLHIDAKVLVTVMWTILSVLVALLSIFLLAVDSNAWQQMLEGWPSFLRAIAPYGASVYSILAEAIVLVLVSIAQQTLHIYLSIAVGNFSSRHKLLAAFGVFIGINVVEQTVMSMIMNLSESVPWKLLDSAANTTAIEEFLGLLIAFAVVFGAVYYFFTEWILSRKLNLE